jgi:membrane protease subunit (stomatin/prohibitin family)
MGLINLGIRIIDNVDTDLRRLGQRLGYVPLSWRQAVMMNPAKDGILWRVPDPDIRMTSTLVFTQAILVAENEQAMVLRNGALMRDREQRAILPPGLYDISRMQRREQLEIIWTTTKELRLRWGVPDVLTQDGISIGASGYYSAVIEDPEKFLRNVAGNVQVYTEEKLFAFAKPDVTSVVRDLMARKTVKEFQIARQEFINACRQLLQPIFEHWGLEFRRLTIEHQNIPEQYRQAAAARTIVSMEKEAQLEGAKVDVSLAQLEAQKQLFFAQAEASKMLAIGKVEVELMQAQREIGVDPLELKKIEAIEALAANAGQGSLVDNRPQIVNQILAEPSPPSPVMSVIMGSVIPPVSPVVPPSLPPAGPASDSVAGAVTPPASASVGGPMTREKIEEMLAKLDERLLAGDITEQKHSELYSRLQKKLSEMHW